MEEFSFKELYDVSLKTTQPLEFCGHNFEKGEIIAIFDKINIANIHEIKKTVSAKGGYNNANLVTWEHTQQVDFHFTQGVFSKSQFGLLMNANMIYQINGGGVVISKREKVASAVFLGVMVASMFFVFIEHIWVGFKFENSYSFPISVLFLIGAGIGIQKLK